MPMKTQKISRRAALTRTGAVLGAAALAGPSLEGAQASSAETPKKNTPFLFCLNTATIRGQKLGLMKEIEVAGKAGGSEASLQSLIGDGYSQLGKTVDAAKAYERAADAAEFDTERAYYRAKAARSYATAGNVNDAKRIWSQLATDEKAQAVAAEARVRLAELTAKPAKS